MDDQDFNKTSRFSLRQPPKMSTQTLASTAAIALSLACTLMLLALNLSGPPGSPGTLNG